MVEGRNLLLDKLPYFELFITMCSGKGNYPSKIAFLIGKKQSTISEQMENLEKDGILEKKMDGKYATYSIVWERVVDLANFAIERQLKLVETDYRGFFEEIGMPDSELIEKSIKEINESEKRSLNIWEKVKGDKTFHSIIKNSVEIFCKEWLKENTPEEIDETFSKEIIEIFDYILECASKLMYCHPIDSKVTIPKNMAKLLNNLNLIHENQKGLVLVEKYVAYMAMKKSLGEYLAEEVFSVD